MCEKASTCGCSGKAASSGVGTAPLWAGCWFLGTCFAIAIAIQVARDIWPYALAGAAVIAAYRVAAWTHRRRVLARSVPVPDPVLVAAPARTRVENVTVLPLTAGMRKTPGPMIRAGRRIRG